MRTLLSFAILLLISPGIALAVWGEKFSTSFSAGTTISRSSASFSTPSSYSTSSDNSDYLTAQTFSIPASFQAIINKFDISRAVVPAEATIQQGLLECLTFLNNSPLEGNDYKAAIIQPITGLLLSGDYSETTRSLCFSNLIEIVLNERIDYSQKSTMVKPLIKYMENAVTAVNNGTISAETGTSEISEIDTIFSGLPRCKDITVEEQKDILVSIATNNLLYQDSAIKPFILGLKANVYETLLEDTDYPLTLIDNSNKDRGKLALAHSLENAIDQTTDLIAISDVIAGLNAFLKDSRLPSSELSTIKDKTISVLENKAGDNYDLRMVCLSTLMDLSKDTRLTEAERNEVKEAIYTYGLNSYNTTIYENIGVLLLSQNMTDYQSRAAAVIAATLSSIPENKRPVFISLERQITSSGKLGNIVETDALHGTYSMRDDVIAVKVADTYTDANYKSTVLHETTHYLEDNVLTVEQKSALQSIWAEANDSTDFVNTLGQQNMSEYLATTAEAVLMEYNAADKPVFAQAQQQAANGDPTLLEIYQLAQEVWDLS